jgi:hypothetical protein
VKNSLVDSLTRLRVTPIIWRNAYYDKATRKTIKELRPFTILSELKIIQKEVDGTVNQAAGFFRFDKHILGNLSNGHTTPLIYDVAISFKSEIAQLLYPRIDLIMYDKKRYERRTEGLFDDLGLKGKTYAYASVRKRRLEPALSEMEGKPLTSGILTLATLERTTDGKDYKVVFEKKAYRKRKKKTDNTQSSTSGETSALAQELYRGGIRPGSKCQEVVETYPEEQIQEKIGMYDAGIIEGGGGLVRAIEQDWQPTEKQRQSVAITKKEQKSRDRKERWKEEREQQIDQELENWDKIPPEKRVDSMFKFWLLAKKVDENSEAARMRKQEYIDKLPKSKPDIRRYINEKVVPIEPPEDFE